MAANTPTLRAAQGCTVSEIVPELDWREVRCAEHFVQFYETDAYLVDSVAAYFAAGFPAGDAGVVIATELHARAIEERLRGHGFDVVALKASGQFEVLDAAATLALFMVEGEPDRARFFESVGRVIAAASVRRQRVRAFGEMVSALWADGQQQAAVRLEMLWNELAEVHAFALFCAYPLRSLEGEENSAAFLQVCRAHHRVIPSETFMSGRAADDRMRCVSVLQKKASAAAAETAAGPRAETLSREEETKLAAVTVADVGIWELDLQTHEFVLSDCARLHLGFGVSDAASLLRLLERVHAADRGGVERALTAAMGRGAGFSIEFRVPCGEDQVRWVSATGRQLDRGGRRLVGATLDVTARRSAGAAIETIVTERTKELREVVKELETFAFSVSHDLRSPLRSMRNYAEILMHECGAALTPHGRHYLDRISASAARMDRLIEDILAFSRVSRADAPLEPVDLDRLARAVVDSASTATTKAALTIDGTLPWVFGNVTALTQCLSNLIENALKFVAPGVAPRVRIWAELVPERDGIDWMRLNVQDNGIGIPAGAHDAIFEMFHRLGGPGYEGTGLGLAIVQKAVTRMGGCVGVSSGEGQGSTFWVELRRAVHRARNSDVSGRARGVLRQGS